MDDLNRQRVELELQYEKKTTDNIVMCYHEKISPYWSALWAKAALLTGRRNMSEGQYFIHLACSLHHCERLFFWAVYNNTCALYFPQINGNARGATQDGCQGQVNLSTAEQRHTDRDNRNRTIHWTWAVAVFELHWLVTSNFLMFGLRGSSSVNSFAFLLNLFSVETL